MNRAILFAIVTTALLICGVAVAQDTAVFGDHFAQGKLECYLANAQSLKPGQAVFTPLADGAGNALVLDKNTVATFKPVPVKENMKYRFVYKVRVETKETIEENPRLELLRLSNFTWLPYCEMVFFDADMKPMAFVTRHVKTLPFGTWFNDVEEFYPPAKAAFMQVSINTNKDARVFINDMQLAPAPDEGAINTNPTFALGRYNYSGWPRRHSAGRLLEKPDGKFMLDTGYGSGSETFPLSEPGTYRLYAKGTHYGGYSTVILHFFAGDGKQITQVEVNSTPAGAQKDFLLPAGTVRGDFLVYNNILEELRLTRIGDESLAQQKK